MGKRISDCPDKCRKQKITQATNNQQKKATDFSISEKNYLQFFQFLKELHAPAVNEKYEETQLAASLNNITSSIMNFFNFEKVYTNRQLEYSTICLANLFNVIGNNVASLTFERQFILKLRKVASDLAQEPSQLGFQQKIQALLYILVVLIYKERIVQVKSIRQLNKRIFTDRIFVKSLLLMTLPLDKKISKFYGIVITYLSCKNNNHKYKQLIIKSILKNFSNIDHEPTLFNLLVLLRSEKNKVSINLKDVNEGNIFSLLIKAYPTHIHQYQSYYILDYLQHLLLLFPSLAQQVNTSRFLPYLVETAGPINLHHPLHESTIISFIQSTLKYLDSSSKQCLLQELTRIQPPNNYITIKLVQMLIEFEIQTPQLITFVFQGYFDRLLGIIQSEEEQAIKKRAAQLYLIVHSKIKTINVSISQYLLHKLKQSLLKPSNQQLLSLVSEVNLQVLDN